MSRNTIPSGAVIDGLLDNQMNKYTTYYKESRWVSEGMADFLNRPYQVGTTDLLPNTPILIKAPTGTGKTTFVEKDLATFAARMGTGKRVLVLVNRKVLAEQILSDECRISLGYSFSPSSLSGIHQTGSVIVYTYQHFAGDYLAVMNSLRLPDNIAYVVLDEAHFFAADALFNNATKNILDNILWFSACKQRIYMSATPEDVRDIIAYEEFWLRDKMKNIYIQKLVYEDRAAAAVDIDNQQATQYVNTSPITQDELNATSKKHEMEIQSHLDGIPNNIIEYIFPPRPHNINLQFFYQWETILYEINESDEDDQWLIFVASVEEGEALKKELKGDAAFIYSGNGSCVLDKLELTATFEEKVLITTSVLDNGINIINSNHHNVVIDAVDAVQIHQMLGRKRKDDKEMVNLYIRNKTSSDFETYYKSLDNKLAAINSFETNYFGFLADKYDYYDLETRRMFGYDKSTNLRYVNPYSRYILGKRQSEYMDMIVKLGSNEFAFAEFVCRLFDLDFEENMIMSDDIYSGIRNQIKRVLDDYLNKEFSQDDLVTIRDRLQEIIKPIKRGTGMSGSKNLNRIKEVVNGILEFMFKDESTKYQVVKHDNMFSIDGIITE